MTSARLHTPLTRTARALANIRSALHTATRICDELAGLVDTYLRKDLP